MAGIAMRPYQGEADLPLIADLVRAVSPASRHMVDLPWRLASPAGETGRDRVVWEGADGALVGLTAWQMWWATLDYFVRPGPHQAEVEEAIFAWAPGRFRELDAARGRPLPYWAEAREDDAARLALLARHGFTLEDDYVYIMLARPLAVPLPQPSLPPGFAIRPLAGASEAAAYTTLHRRAFASTSMTPEWRVRTLRMPQHRPELDLVAVTPGRELAGFCVAWLAPERGCGQIEPLGVDPDYQGLGLARALLHAICARLAACGVEYALVETESTRAAALAAYGAAGFRPAYRSLRRGRLATEP